MSARPSRARARGRSGLERCAPGLGDGVGGWGPSREDPGQNLLTELNHPAVEG